ncbi:MAG: biotin/lipoate A/B protein ligase family protein [Candidatus Woesearchaeota archaeon]
METWRLIRTIETDGARQMAIDEAILTHRIKGEVPNTLRFFTWKPECLTIGYFQDLDKEVDTERARTLGVDIVRRYTGGGAVFHDDELTYSLAVSEQDVPQDIIGSYEAICGAITKGLERAGVHAEFRPVNDIVVNNKKISGNAQTRKEGVVLQHGTVLVDVDVKKLFSLLRVSDEKMKGQMIKTVEERVTSLSSELGRPVSMDELQDSLIAGFEEAFDVRFEERGLTESELSLAEELRAEKYSTKEWRELR